MGREHCMMCEIHGGQIYCGYYDAFYMLCEENEHCPEELDDEEFDDSMCDDEEEIDPCEACMTNCDNCSRLP